MHDQIVGLASLQKVLSLIITREAVKLLFMMQAGMSFCTSEPDMNEFFIASLYSSLQSCIVYKITLLMANFHRRDQLGGINFLNVQILPESPTQNGTDAILSFFVNLPSGTMPLELLTTIFTSDPNIITQPNSVIPSPNPNLRDDQIQNLVALSTTTEVNTVHLISVIVPSAAASCALRHIAQEQSEEDSHLK